MSLAALILVALVQPGVDRLSWMSGYWLSCEDGREVSETWSDPRGGLMAGHGMTFHDGQASFEASHIGPHAGGLAYFARPNGQPATIFPAVEVSEGRVVFENPDHDFPRRIVYARAGDDLVARIEGEMQGRAAAMEWRYRPAALNARCPA